MSKDEYTGCGKSSFIVFHKENKNNNKNIRIHSEFRILTTQW